MAFMKKYAIPGKIFLATFVLFVFNCADSIGDSKSSLHDTHKPYSFLSKMLDATNGEFEIVYVENRKAGGEGSFKAAVTGGTSDVTRLVLFAVNGVIDLGVHGRNKNLHKTLYIGRDNLWIAGQSSPPAPDDNGRGVHIYGGLRFGGSNVVVDHVRVQPWVGPISPDLKPDAEGILWLGLNRGTGHKRFMVRNCSVHGTSDEATVIKPNHSRDTWIEQAGFVGCFLTGALNGNMVKVHNGADPSELGYKDGHSYGPMTGAGVRKMLYHGNLLTSMVRRAPQYGTGSSGLIINNYVFNYGRHHDGNNSSAVPFMLNFSGDRNEPGQTHLECILGYSGNYVEGGCRTNPWQNEGRLLRQRDHYTADDLHYWDGEDNLHLTYYDRSGIDEGRPGYYLAAKNTELRSSIQAKWDPAPPLDEGIGKRLIQPPFALTSTHLPAEQVKKHCLNHAGAWPAYRNQLDRLLINEVIDKTNDARGVIPKTTPITPVSRVYPSDLPEKPLFIEKNGLTAIENWLHERHVEAGGYDAYDAAEWFSRE